MKILLALTISAAVLAGGCSSRIPSLPAGEPVQLNVEQVLNDGERLYLSARVRVTPAIHPSNVSIALRGTRGFSVLRESRKLLSESKHDPQTDSYVVLASIPVTELEDYQFEAELLSESKVFFFTEIINKRDENCVESVCNVSYEVEGRIINRQEAAFNGSPVLKIIFLSTAGIDSQSPLTDNSETVPLGTLILESGAEQVLKVQVSATISESLKDFVRPQVYLENDPVITQKKEGVHQNLRLPDE